MGEEMEDVNESGSGGFRLAELGSGDAEEASEAEVKLVDEHMEVEMIMDDDTETMEANTEVVDTKMIEAEVENEVEDEEEEIAEPKAEAEPTVEEVAEKKVEIDQVEDAEEEEPQAEAEPAAEEKEVE